jgi:hypothetical protein
VEPQHAQLGLAARCRRGLLLAAVLHLRLPGGPERQEPRRVPGHGHDEYADVERHERKHEQVRHAYADCVQGGTRRPGRDAAPPGGEAGLQRAGGQELEDEREHEDDGERQRVHAAARSGPPREEDLRLPSRVEGHVRVVLLHRRHGADASHAVPSHIHGYLPLCATDRFLSWRRVDRSIGVCCCAYTRGGARSAVQRDGEGMPFPGGVVQ